MEKKCYLHRHHHHHHHQNNPTSLLKDPTHMPSTHLTNLVLPRKEKKTKEARKPAWNSAPLLAATTASSLEAPFAIRVHRMLTAVSELGMEDIVSWNPDGRTFRVHQPREFERWILPNYFSNQTQYRSFQRQLNFYAFSRIKTGQLAGSYGHVCFVKGQEALAHCIQRVPKGLSSLKLEMKQQIVSSERQVQQSPLYPNHIVSSTEAHLAANPPPPHSFGTVANGSVTLTKMNRRTPVMSNTHNASFWEHPNTATIIEESSLTKQQQQQQRPEEELWSLLPERGPSLPGCESTLMLMLEEEINEARSGAPLTLMLQPLDFIPDDIFET
ncbi:HSF-type DNA-binding protein [Nitzschia inconspicua]|uniref:HSF-type DNA-binding protein n=1 Tax=Nitzschia inconspicua TaxID=303405 RepID=A0A9K3LJU0_9STRA|nr:HSF-type DNA-binding protein [Nitzschia inconspicua]